MNARRSAPSLRVSLAPVARGAALFRRACSSALSVALGLALLAPQASAESLWGMEGIGRPVTPYDHAARGAGSTGIAIDDPFGMSFVNPAAIAHAQLPQAHFGVAGQDRWIQTDTRGPDRRMDVRVTMGRVVLPGPGPLRWSVGYRDLTDGSYQVKLHANAGREDEYVRTWQGSGGVGELSAGVAAKLSGGRIAAGLQVGFANGTLLEVVEDRFTSGAYLQRRDILRTRVLDGRSLGLGAQFALLPGLSLGAAWRSSSAVDLRSLATSADAAHWEDRASFDLPSELGLGAAVRRGRIRMAADWNRAAWGKGTFHTAVGQAGASLGSFRDTNRLGLGITLFPPASEAKGTVARRAVWRAGFSWEELPVRQRPATAGATGVGISEWAVTAGCGLPVKVDRGFLDLFLEAGRTGNLKDAGLRETFVRIGVGVTFGRFAKAF